MLEQKTNIGALVVILINSKCLWFRLSWKPINLIKLLRDIEIVVGTSAIVDVSNGSI